MSSFDEREKGFEKKFAHDEEIQFKISARKNKYLGEWASKILGHKEQYIAPQQSGLYFGCIYF